MLTNISKLRAKLGRTKVASARQQTTSTRTSRCSTGREVWLQSRRPYQSLMEASVNSSIDPKDISSRARGSALTVCIVSKYMLPAIKTVVWVNSLTRSMRFTARQQPVSMAVALDARLCKIIRGRARIQSLEITIQPKIS